MRCVARCGFVEDLPRPIREGSTSLSKPMVPFYSARSRGCGNLLSDAAQPGNTNNHCQRTAKVLHPPVRPLSFIKTWSHQTNERPGALAHERETCDEIQRRPCARRDERQPRLDEPSARGTPYQRVSVVLWRLPWRRGDIGYFRHGRLAGAAIKQTACREFPGS